VTIKIWLLCYHYKESSKVESLQVNLCNLCITLVTLSWSVVLKILFCRWDITKFYINCNYKYRDNNRSELCCSSLQQYKLTQNPYNWKWWHHFWHRAFSCYTDVLPNQLTLHSWRHYVQGVPIKNNPLGNIDYLSYCNIYFKQIYSFPRGRFAPHTQQISLHYLLWFRNYNHFNLKVQFCKWTSN